MAEILEFRVPVGHDRTLLVLGLETDAAEHALYLAFSAFGPLYSVRLHRNAAVAGPGYNALIKYYSARDAGRAQRACNQQPLFQKSPLKLQDISGFEEEEKNEEEGAKKEPGSQCWKYLCVQELTIPQHGICTRGVGVAEAPVDPSQEFLTAMRSVQKLAAQKALSDAFQKILLVVLENGKVAVEFSCSQESLVDCLTDEELQGLLQVTDLSSSQLNPEAEEEILSDVSIDGD